MTDHPITPSAELMAQWIEEDEGGPGVISRLAARAAQWGADQELGACCALMDDWGLDGNDLMECRRPKPSSLKEQALKAAHIEVDPQGKNGSLIIRALEALPDD